MTEQEKLISKVEHKFVGQIPHEYKGVKDTVTECIHVTTTSRRNGNTYRQVDAATDLLFRGYVVVCFDHDKDGGDRKFNINLMELVMRRLQNEHKIGRVKDTAQDIADHSTFINNDELVVLYNTTDFTLRLQTIKSFI